jgi:hypothetical protein
METDIVAEPAHDPLQKVGRSAQRQLVGRGPTFGLGALLLVSFRELTRRNRTSAWMGTYGGSRLLCSLK